MGKADPYGHGWSGEETLAEQVRLTFSLGNIRSAVIRILLAIERPVGTATCCLNEWRHPNELIPPVGRFGWLRSRRHTKRPVGWYPELRGSRRERLDQRKEFRHERNACVRGLRAEDGIDQLPGFYRDLEI